MSELRHFRRKQWITASANSLADPKLLYLTGAFFLTFQEAAAKWLTHHYPINEIVFFRACFSLVVIAVFLAATGRFHALKTNRIGQHLLRGGLIAVSIFLSILGLRYLPLATALSLSYSAPLFLTILSALLLGERVTKQLWLAVVLGFVGALIILQPTLSGFQMPGLYILASALSYALAVILTRSLTKTETVLTTLIYGILTTAVLSAMTLPIEFVIPAADHLPVLVALGAGGVVSTYLFVQALSSAEVNKLAPLDYSRLIWGALLGFLIWRDIPSFWTCLGAALIIGVGLYVYRTRIVR